MTVVYFDSPMSDDERRAQLFAGNIFVYSATPSSLKLCEFAREMAAVTFAPHDPRDAQHHLDRQHYVDLLAKLKPEFIHHSRSKQLLCSLVEELGVDPQQTYFDVPRLRTMTSEYLNAGLALQFEPHRDTWFANPACQVNWWMPIYEVAENSVMAFHPRYFSEGVRNSSQIYDYADWLANGRVAAATQVEKDTRKRSALEQEIEREPDIRVISPPGGIMLFSGAHLHTTIPNTSGRTRFSIDFRTVHRGDIENRVGARNVDSAATGTTLGDFLRVADLEHLPAELVKSYAGEPVGASSLA